MIKHIFNYLKEYEENHKLFSFQSYSTNSNKEKHFDLTNNEIYYGQLTKFKKQIFKII